MILTTLRPQELQNHPLTQSAVGAIGDARKLPPQVRDSNAAAFVHQALCELPAIMQTRVTSQSGHASGYGCHGNYGLSSFGMTAGAEVAAPSNRVRRSLAEDPGVTIATDEHQNSVDETDSNGPSAVTPVAHPIRIRTDYSDYSLTEFLDSLALALKDPFGEFFKQIAVAAGGSPEHIDAAKQVGGHISNVLQMVAGPGGAVMHGAGSAVQMASNAFQGKPPEIDDVIDVGSMQRVVLPSPGVSLTSAGGEEQVADLDCGDTEIARSRLALVSEPVSEIDFRSLAADELAPYRSQHTDTAGEIENIGVYVTHGQALVPINGALYRIQTDGAGQSRLVEPGKQVFDTRSPHVMQNQDGSFTAGYPRLVGGGGNSSRQARASSSADSGFSRSHSSLSGASKNVSRSVSISSASGSSIDSPAIARNTQPGRTGRENISVFEVPPEDRPELEDAINFGASKWQLDPDYARGRVPEDLVETRYHLLRKSNAFYATVRLPARPEMPMVTENTSAESFIRGVYEHADGLVIGEQHNSMASKQFLIDNMAAFKKQQVTTLYMEHLLTDFHQDDLDAYFDTGTMSDKLQGYLEKQDGGQGTNTNSAYTFQNVVETARKNQIRIQAVDAAASYHLKDIYDPVPGPTRQKAMNYFAREVIKADVKFNGRHNWVALVGNTHANTFQRVPGIAELTDAIGLRVQDVAANQATRFTVDQGTVGNLGIGQGSGTVKSDFLLQIGTGWQVSPST